jgi:hypothetical protein
MAQSEAFSLDVSLLFAARLLAGPLVDGGAQYCICVLFRLGSYEAPAIDGAQADFGWQEILAGVVPAVAVFGIYRIWIAGIEFCPSAFYFVDEAEQEINTPDLKGIDPTLKTLSLSHKCNSEAGSVLGVFMAALFHQIIYVNYSKT